MSRTQGRSFDLAPGLRLRVEGPRATVAHFSAEYGRVAAADAGTGSDEGAQPALVVRFGRDLRRDGDRAGWTLHDRLEPRTDGHRWLRWSVALSRPAAAGVTSWIQVGGKPRGVALSLIQGWVVEPLLSLVAPSSGHVLVPGAAISTPAGLVLILADSGAGKSSLSARAIARGLPVLGDDQVLLDASGLCRPFPRRVRVYPDLSETAPAAHAGLPLSARARLGAHRFLALASRGRIRPSLPVDPSRLGPWQVPEPQPVARVLLVEPRVRCVAPRLDPVSVGDAVVTAEHLLRKQRTRFGWVASPAWHAAVESIARTESAIVADALRDAPVARLQLPRALTAAQAVDVLAAELGIEDARGAARDALAIAGATGKTGGIDGIG